MIVWLEIELDSETFYKLVKHITYAMFFGIKRIASDLNHVIFHSVGDHLDASGDLQDYENCEIFLEKRVGDSVLDQKSIKQIMKDTKWHIKVINSLDKTKIFSFVVNKSDNLITYRKASWEIKTL